MKIRTLIFGVYVGVTALGFAALMALTLRDVRLRYVESMRRTMGDTAVFLATFAAAEPQGRIGAAAWRSCRRRRSCCGCSPATATDA
ncbi:hypothetical protein [Oleiharenicola sp. Vm1]|uniref:hypothetical protein n=1 Tax=Oleiharenicola sp. Vm1 TaxID=3398393 RepID=UPI0039F4F6C8